MSHLKTLLNIIKLPPDYLLLCAARNLTDYKMEIKARVSLKHETWKALIVWH